MNIAETPSEQPPDDNDTLHDATPAVAEPRRNRLLGVVSVLWSPSRSFREFADGKGFVFVLLAMLTIDVVMTILAMPRLNAELDKQLLTAPPSVAEMRTMITAVTMIIVATLNILVLGFAALILTLVVKIFRGKAGIAAVFSGLLLASVPTALGRSVQGVLTALGYSADGVRDALSVATIFGIDKGESLYPVAKLILVFDLWTLVLVGLGFSIVSGLRRVPAWILSLSIWILLQSVLVRFVLAAGATG